MTHNAIILTSWKEAAMLEAHEKAKEIFASSMARVTNITQSAMNDYMSFMVAPDGSKDGWPDSDRGDECRAQFIAYLRDGYAKRGIWLYWVEVEFYEDMEAPKVLQGTHLLEDGTLAQPI